MVGEPMIELYHGDRTRSLRVRWPLEELGVPYRLHPVLFPPRLRQPEYLAENPLGSLPSFVDGKVRMTESMAICEYLVQKYGPTSLAVDPDEPGFAAFRQFCWFGEASLMPPIGTLVGHVMMTAPERRPTKIVDDARELLARRLQPIAQALSTAEHLAAHRFTLADVSVGYALGLAAQLGEGALFSDEIVRYCERLRARPAYGRASALVNNPQTQSEPK